MLQDLTDSLRVAIDGALSSARGNEYRPIRLLREVLGTANDLAGRPFCSRDELERRRQRRRPAAGAPGVAAPAREAAPVVVYFDGRDHRTLARVEELLRARGIPFRTLDVADDEASRSWASTAARGKEFPLVFVAGEPLGGLHEITQLDVNGGLVRSVYR